MQTALEGVRRGAPPAEFVSEGKSSEALLAHVSHWLDEAKAEAYEAKEEFISQIADARHEAARIREEAREQGAAIVAELREQAQTEANRIVEHAHVQIQAERQQALTSLRVEVGTLATTLAGRIVGESLEDDERSRRVVERFLADLETLETSTAAASSNGAG